MNNVSQLYKNQIYQLLNKFKIYIFINKIKEVIKIIIFYFYKIILKASLIFTVKSTFSMIFFIDMLRKLQAIHLNNDVRKKIYFFDVAYI